LKLPLREDITNVAVNKLGSFLQSPRVFLFLELATQYSWKSLNRAVCHALFSFRGMRIQLTYCVRIYQPW
jgi:hypothetical protein